MVVPPRAIHTFMNPSDEEDAEFFMTATPGKLVSSPPPQYVARTRRSEY